MLHVNRLGSIDSLAQEILTGRHRELNRVAGQPTSGVLKDVVMADDER